MGEGEGDCVEGGTLVKEALFFERLVGICEKMDVKFSWGRRYTTSGGVPSSSSSAVHAEGTLSSSARRAS